MNPLDLVKIRLSRYLRPRIDKKVNRPIDVVASEEDVTLLFQNQIDPQTVLRANSTDGFDFSIEEVRDTKTRVKERIIFTQESHMIVSDFKINKKRVIYFGDRSIQIAYSTRINEWLPQQKPVLLDAKPLSIGAAWKMPGGILILYFQKETEDGLIYRTAHIAYADENNPEKIIWKMDQPIWKQKEQWPDRYVEYVGTVMFRKKLISYWYVDNAFVYAVSLSGFPYDPRSISIRKNLKLTKFEANPIIEPNDKNHWEAFNTFNPAAVVAGGKVHILYRAQGFDYVSTVGYAVSNDGIAINGRSEKPIYTPSHQFEVNTKQRANYDYLSGGSFGGCEDPRVTLIDDRIYMVYVAFDGWSPQQLALTSILLTDFLAQRWNWTKPVLVSRPGIIDKSGCLLPEKINGKYVFFHRVFPNILIDFVDDLNFDGKTRWLKGEYQIPIREKMWDSRKIGAGAPPLRTKDGWLFIYYGVDDRDAGKYHIGAMLLDLKDPTKVLHRSNHPILEPSEDYENTGFKPGVAYPCGAVIVKNRLLVYYGGADSVVCVAIADLNTFLRELTATETAHLTPIQIQEVDC